MRTPPFGWWIVKALLSALYWLSVLYVATGLFFGDRIDAQGRIAPPESVVPPWAFFVLVVLLYAGLSSAWNHALKRWRTPSSRH